MFADPLTVTVNGVAKNLIRIRQDNYSSEYLLRTATDEFKLAIRNTTRADKKAGVAIDRHNIELVHTVFPVAPATTGTTRKVYAVIENQIGDTLSDPQYVAQALFALLTAGNITKLLNWES